MGNHGPGWKRKVASSKEVDLNSRPPLRWFFVWAWTVVWKIRAQTSRVTFTNFDFGRLRGSFINTEALINAWRNEVSMSLNKKPSMLRALYKCYGIRYTLIGIWKIIWTISTWMGGFYFLKKFLLWIEKDLTMSFPGHMWALALLISGLISTISINQLHLECSSVSIQLRATLSGLLYSKLMVISNIDPTECNVVNLFSVDISNVADSVSELHYLWSAFVEIILIIALLTYEINYASIASIILLLIFLPIQIIIGIKMSDVQKNYSTASIRRVHFITELFTAIKIIKFYAWERPFARNIADVRKNEVIALEKTFSWKSLSYTLVFVVPPLCAFMSLYMYVVIGNKITTTTAFVILSLLNTLRYPLLSLPSAANAFFTLKSSLNQITKFMLAPEINSVNLKDPPPDNPSLVFSLQNATFAWENSQIATLNDITLSLKRGEVVAIIGNVGAGKSSLLASLIGQTNLIRGVFEFYSQASYAPQEAWLIGGQSLRSNILFGKKYEHERYRKVISVCGLASDIENMPFGDLTEVAERGANLSGGQKHRVSLARAVYSSSRLILLDSPLAALDQSVGKAIFDDCILNFLAKVENRAVLIVTQQLQYLKKVDRIAIMDDSRIIMCGSYNELCENSKFQEIIKHHVADVDDIGLDTDNLELSEDEELLEDKEDSPKYAKENSLIECSPNSLSPETPASNKLFHIKIREDDLKRKNKNNRPALVTSNSFNDYNSKLKNSKSSIFTTNPDINFITTKSKSQLTSWSTAQISKLSKQNVRKMYEYGNTSILSRDDGSIRNLVSIIRRSEATISSYMELSEGQKADENGFSASKNTSSHSYMTQDKAIIMTLAQNYLVYLRAGSGILISLFVVSLFFAVHGIRIGFDFWVNSWIKTTKSFSREFYMSTATGAICIIMFGLGNFIRARILSSECKYKSTSLHNSAFNRVLNATQSFFDTTPISRILSIFSKYQVALDNSLPNNILLALQFIPLALGSIILCAILIPYTYAPVILCTIFSVIIHSYVSKAEKNLKDQDALSKPILISHIITTTEGLSSIRAYSFQQSFIKLNYKNVDRNNKILYASYVSKLLVAFSIDVFASLIIYTTALFIVLFNKKMFSNPSLSVNSQGYINEIAHIGSTSGIALSNSLQLLVFLQWSVRSIGNISEDISSAGQLTYYASDVVPLEAPAEIKETKPPATWPSDGEIVFKNVYLKYHEYGIDVLKDVCFTIEPRKKIGLVGRTGSGKSTLLISLLRIVELSKGSIFIDGIDVRKIGIHDLRRNIAVIPQESVLFSGTIRSNIDPYNEKSDDVIWDALEKVKLKDYVAALPGSLDYGILDNGSSYSLGQRQLFCIARAIIADSKIIVLDEASSALDPETDKMVQQIFRSSFKDKTILTIAHRLNTIIDSDKILLMDYGVMKEFDEPLKLIKNPDSEFSKLINKYGKQAAIKLTAEAQAAYDAKQKAKSQENELESA